MTKPQTTIGQVIHRIAAKEKLPVSTVLDRVLKSYIQVYKPRWSEKHFDIQLRTKQFPNPKGSVLTRVPLDDDFPPVVLDNPPNGELVFLKEGLELVAREYFLEFDTSDSSAAEQVYKACQSDPAKYMYLLDILAATWSDTLSFGALLDFVNEFGLPNEALEGKWKTQSEVHSALQERLREES